MRSAIVQILTAFAFFAIAVNAQEPAFKGELLLQPGLTSTKCITAASNADGAQVAIQDCNDDVSQKWVFGGGVLKVFDNKCLDVPSGNNVDGTTLQIWTCTQNNNNQKWAYNVYSNQLTWINTNKCADLTGGNLDNGNRIQIWDCNNGINQVWDVGYSANDLPQTSQDGQYGINNCGTTSSSTSNCQTAWVNSGTDFCLWAPPVPGNIGDTEREEVAYCSKSGRGTRLIPDDTLKGVHFVKTPEYVQVTGVGDFTKMNILKGDSGGELDNRGADGKGNPVGGLIFGNTFGPNLQYHEWTSFISDSEFCIRACVGARARELCNHIYDLQGCYWNMPANYDAGVFEQCDGDVAQPMGVYGTSTWYQGVNPTPTAHPAPASSNCVTLPSSTDSPLRKRQGDRLVRRVAFPGATPAPDT